MKRLKSVHVIMNIQDRFLVAFNYPELSQSGESLRLRDLRSRLYFYS